MNIKQAHAHCATLPGATLDHKWKFEDSEHPVYSVGGRMFAMFSMKAGKLLDTIMFKADDARFLELTDREGIVPMPYLARAKWVKVEGIRRLADAELKHLIAEAHAVILAKSSKKMQAAILGAAASTSVNKTTPRSATTVTRPATKSATKAGPNTATAPVTKVAKKSVRKASR